VSPLLNYTTTVPASKTISAVHGLLVKAGARQIMTEYSDEGSPTGISFTLKVPEGTRAFTLPVSTDRVLKVLERDGRMPGRAYPNQEQAERVGWRIVKDWLEAQLAILQTEMVTFDQIMLPYMRGNDGRTIYELYLADQLPALGPGVD